ncbi:hypothetical protein [Prochlorococcus marinus]|uniref:hypothetical protein n=1 Tax=Prochlorococcus marinus TaxID=1219 RepID=UPI0022B56008|nr:hypothetical protein [Prochlorococcus marinus]
MNAIDDALKRLFNSFKNKGGYKGREMKRVFQLRRYIEWKGLTKEEKLFAKRLFFMPIVAYFVFVFINQNSLALIVLICIYFAYKKFEKGTLTK